MITGDHAATAGAIAAASALGTGGADGPPRVVTGAELDACPDDRARGRAPRRRRVRPRHPRAETAARRALQADGEVVAMTGDGSTTPGPQPGRHRGGHGPQRDRGGREAADIVLADDDFASIEAAVEEGRRHVRQPDEVHRLDPADEHRAWGCSS